MVEIKVNGEILHFNSSLSVSELLEFKNFKTERVAVELDGKILKKSFWNSTKIANGQIYEIVELVGGG
ncbi:sulfur carrier protein ThiS [Campylobacter hominis]